MKKSFRALMLTAALLASPAAIAAPTAAGTAKVEPGGLYEIVVDPRDNDLYVAAVGPRGANEAAIVRLDPTTLAPKGRISVADNPLYGIALNSRTGILYGTDTRAGVVSAVDLASGRVVATIEDRPRAHVRQVAIDEAVNRVYVSEVGGRGENTDPSRIWIIDGAENRLLRTIQAPGMVLTGLALDVPNGRVFSTDMVANEVVVIDLASGAVAHRWPTGGESTINVVHDAEGGRLFATNQGSGTLTVMNAADGSVIRTVETGEGALSVAYNPAVGQIYVANRRAGTTSVLDSASYEKIADVETGTLPQTIAIDRATNAVYVTNKARGLPRGAPEGTPVPVDPTGDVVTIVRP